MRIRYLLLTGLLIVFVSMTSAQSTTVKFVNETNTRISESSVQAAAQPLIDKHQAQVVVYAVVSGGKDDLTQRLSDDHIAFSRTPENLVAIYIVTEERYSELRWGENYAIDGADIRSNVLNPNLRNGDYETAIVETLNALDKDITGFGLPLPIEKFIHEFKEGGIFAILFIIVAVLGIGQWIFQKLGLITASGSSYTNDQHDDANFSNDTSWDSGDSGGSDGGSWDD